jgi:signal transduction histidine kinase
MQTATTDPATDGTWQRPGPTARQRRNDVLIGAAVVMAALLNLMMARSTGLFMSDDSPPVAEQFCWSLAVTVPLIWRRRFPDVVVVVVAIAFIAGQVRGNPEQQVASGAIWASIYTLGVWGRDRRRVHWLRISVIASMFVWMVVGWWITHEQMTPDGFPGATGELPVMVAYIVNSLVTNVGIFGFAYLAGESVFLATRRRHQLEVQADQLRRAQDTERDQAVFTERVRIARELHDVVAHHVSVMGIQAAAGRRVMDSDPGKARTALAAVEQSARTAVGELHRMLGALRAPDGVADAAPTGAGIDQVEDLVESLRSTGRTVRYAVFGDPVPLPDSVSQAAYRVVQEAVTNVLKHAGTAALDIRIRYLSTDVEVDVADDGPGGDPRRGGMGLIGMRERVAVHDGTLEVGTRPEGGFRVRARLPLVTDQQMETVA